MKNTVKVRNTDSNKITTCVCCNKIIEFNTRATCVTYHNKERWYCDECKNKLTMKEER